MKIAIDFDGTIVQDRYPEIGNERPFATQTIKMLMAEGHQFILWTVREGELLEEAVQWLRDRGIELYAVNKDYPDEDASKDRHYSRKLKVDLFIDDRNVGGLPDWGIIYEIIHSRRSFEQLLTAELQQQSDRSPKKKWWQF